MTADEIIENDLIKTEFIEHVDKIYFDVDRQKLLEIAMKKIDIDKLQNRRYREYLKEVEQKFLARKHINLHLEKVTNSKYKIRQQQLEHGHTRADDDHLKNEP